MKRIMLMGASGSVGSQIIDVIKEHPDKLKLVGVCVGHNIDYLIDILKYFDVKYAYTIEENPVLQDKFPDVRFFSGEKGLMKMAMLPDYDLMVNALVGFTGFMPTLAAIKSHKDIALANKETLVAGGKIICDAVRENGVTLTPIDSEHVAILQCLQGHRKDDIRRLIITASGGSFRDYSRDQLEDVTLEQALKHPVWKMGSKITIDSATMMNKGFEVIEAHYLFDIPYDKIDVVVHKQSIVHSMVEFNDGSIIAQLGCPDMHLMIKYALLYPEHREDKETKYLDLDSITSLEFKKMDYKRFPLVKLAKQVGEYEGNFGAVLNGANDEAVSLFLKKKIRFVDIEKYILKTLKAATYIKNPSCEQISQSHRWAKEYVDELWANS